ncbi:MAG: Lrp/AsnC family transcriptional regulator [Pseudomonadota bacterium]
MEKYYPIDSFDVKILDQLQRDGRASYQDIGEKVGLSLSACHKRVKAMENAGLVQRYAAILDAPTLGRPTSAYVRVTLRDQTKETLANFEDAVQRHEEIMDCVLMSGDSDYLLRILCAGIEDYERIHDDILTTLPGVQRLQSSFALRTVCRRTAVPLNRLLESLK